MFKKNIIILIAILSLTGCSMAKFKEVTSKIGASMPGKGLAQSQSTSIKVAKDIALNKDLWKKSRVNVISHGNSLLLVGQTPAMVFRNECEDVATTAPGVDNVYNQLTIGKPIPVWEQTKDSWITTEIRTKLLATKKLNSNRVKVITENKTVFLLGTLTAEEEKLVTEVAKNTSGITKVVKLINKKTA